eukprot:scaffold56358_cov65-Phaeocystis_antarctica.AAC.2
MSQLRISLWAMHACELLRPSVGDVVPLEEQPADLGPGYRKRDINLTTAPSLRSEWHGISPALDLSARRDPAPDEPPLNAGLPSCGPSEIGHFQPAVVGVAPARSKVHSASTCSSRSMRFRRWTSRGDPSQAARTRSRPLPEKRRIPATVVRTGAPRPQRSIDETTDCCRAKVWAHDRAKWRACMSTSSSASCSSRCAASSRHTTRRDSSASGAASAVASESSSAASAACSWSVHTART